MISLSGDIKEMEGSQVITSGIACGRKENDVVLLQHLAQASAVVVT